MRSVVSEEFKLIEHLDSGLLQLSGLETGRSDRVNQLENAPPEVRDRLVSVLGRFHEAGSVATAPEVEINADVESQLRWLGYITDDVEPGGRGNGTVVEAPGL